MHRIIVNRQAVYGLCRPTKMTGSVTNCGNCIRSVKLTERDKMECVFEIKI